MDHDLRAGILSSVLAAGLIVALTLLAFIGDRVPAEQRRASWSADFVQHDAAASDVNQS